MAKYLVNGLYTISWEMEVDAENEEGAYDIAENNLDIMTEWNGNSVFVRNDDVKLEADGLPFDIEVREMED